MNPVGKGIILATAPSSQGVLGQDQSFETEVATEKNTVGINSTATTQTAKKVIPIEASYVGLPIIDLFSPDSASFMHRGGIRRNNKNKYGIHHYSKRNLTDLAN